MVLDKNNDDNLNDDIVFDLDEHEAEIERRESQEEDISEGGASGEKKKSGISVIDKRFWANESQGDDGKPSRKELPTVMETMKSQINEMKETALKYADVIRKNKEDNEKFRSRINRDFDSRLERAKSDIIYELLEVLDNFERAVSSASSSSDFESFHEGIRMIYGQFLNKLTAMGVRQMETVGTVFNPKEADAIDVIEVEDREKHNYITDELTKGYYFKDQVLRPARVRVCRCSKPEEMSGIDCSSGDQSPDSGEE